MYLIKQKKVLVVAESIDVEDSSGSKANVALILSLREAGFDVLVYHYTRKAINLEGVNCVAIKEKKFNLLFLLSRAQRKIQHGLKINLAKRLEPLLGFSFTFFNDTASIAEALKQIKDYSPDIVLTLSKGASYRPHYALLKLPELHDRWLAYFHDPYPFHYYPDPYQWSEPGYHKKIEFFKEVSEKCLKAAFPSLLLKEWMEKFYPALKNKGIIIPHQLDQAGRKGVRIPEFFHAEKFTLLHAGNLLKQRPPFTLIRGYKKFLDQTPEARKKSQLFLIGNASYHIDELKKYNKNIDQLYISKGYINYDVVLEMQKLASVNIILESEASQSPFLPGKFPHCIRANRIILHLAPEKSEVRRLLGRDYEFWSEINDVDKIAGLITLLYKRWRSGQEMTLNRSDLEFYLSKDFLKQELDRTLQEV
ncbi:UDP-glycosyltransferase [Salinimicrobium sp. TH3]|uniref:UDP-glycosyltransferase n=1 Tax=Salinimicrobium sp. TH3 TaxID=2997342 RepID=UPI002273BFBC|nr:UDP-glycosyltransferase [Salinimicrobium sp. TH3]MCY2687860.1 UDP-glycosyltransferase [Salinimicrobium sp. TH3]